MTFPWYLALGGGVFGLIGAGIAVWFIYRAKTANAERDLAQAQAVAATDLASRLNASLQTLKIEQDKASTNDKTTAQDAGTSADAAAAFLNGMH
ncbi:MAG TPA: hypothetical protein VIY48_07655 [Candidatus Paceibacterota bacterium]